MAENFIIPGKIKADNVPFKSPTTVAVEALEKASKAAEAASIEALNKAKNSSKRADDDFAIFGADEYNNMLLELARKDASAAENAKQIAESAAKNAANAAKVPKFSFRNVGKTGQLHICPPFLCSDKVGSCFNNDIGNKAIYDWASSSFSSSSTSTFASVMNAIPGVTIREYQVDYSIDQIINLMQKFAEGFNSALNAGTSEKDSTSTVWQKALAGLEKLKTAFGKLWDKIQNGEFWKTLSDVVSQYAAPETLRNGLERSENKLAMLAMPYVFYYKLMSYTTTNFYTVPFNGKMLYSTDGKVGWNEGKLGLDSYLPESGIIATIGKNFLKHIAINKSPQWEPDPKSFTGASYEISFQLFNSSIDAAVSNYIFVHNLIPNNMMIQYGLIMQSSCLYDIKIDGGIRCLCCTGSFTVNYKGGLRSVPIQFLDELKIYQNVFNAKVGNSLNLIKIPDVYDITLKFDSLLPNNFNNYLYGFSNPDIGPGFQNSIYTKVMEDVGAEVKKLLP